MHSPLITARHIAENPENEAKYSFLFKEGSGEVLITLMKEHLANPSSRSIVKPELLDSVLWESSSILETYNGRIFVQALVILVEEDGLYSYRLLIYQINKEGAISTLSLNWHSSAYASYPENPGYLFKWIDKVKEAFEYCN